jgi:hypothetical protein
MPPPRRCVRRRDCVVPTGTVVSTITSALRFRCGAMGRQPRRRRGRVRAYRRCRRHDERHDIGVRRWQRPP